MPKIKKTRVVHYKKEDFDVYIGRPSKWGNPFSHKDGTLAKFKTKNREESIKKFKIWIMRQHNLLADLHELRGKAFGVGDTIEIERTLKIINAARDKYPLEKS